MNGHARCRCGLPAVRSIGTVGYCEGCADAFLRPIRERVITCEAGVGFGERIGPLRPDWGDGWTDLRCSLCSATWTGEIGEACGYCIGWLELTNEIQRRVLLHPDLPDGNNEHRRTALTAWVDRLADAVKAEILTEHEALAAIRREEGRRVA